ncbi:uncharacterized protein LOC129753170 [Uranotaenia lowii]|uniref:uncharacterized protein LOC129753170 n=1 Tax=Uranotaenia lowii TaxID=190385 RepID=UPI002478F4B4|nr:uncharacterized protein LOC129753170 [Uranotaenia lowii]
MPSTKKPSVSTVAPSLKVLNMRFKQIQSSFSDIWRFVETFQEDSSSIQIEIRLEEIDNLWEKLNDTLIEIQSHDDFDLDETYFERERVTFSEKYYHSKAFLMEKLKERTQLSDLSSTVRVNDSVMQPTLDHVRLPQIKLQTFNGNIEEWLSFRDLYMSLIHWKTDLPEVEKFHYLKGCLQGEPKALIDPIKITKTNYQIAWDLLLKRYNNSKLFRKRQVQGLFQLPSLTKESVSDLQVLLEGFERIVQTLDQIIQPEEYKDLLLVHLLSSRLDPATRRGWEESSAAKDQDVVQDLTEFLRRRVRVLESLPVKVVEPKVVQPQQVPRFKHSTRGSFSSFQSSGRACVACQADHPLFQCQAFQRMKIEDREGLLRSHSLCRNCFSRSHRAKECKSRYSCRHCKGRHHSLVCFRSDKEESRGSRFRKGTEESKPQEQQLVSAPQVTNLAATDLLSSNAAPQRSSQVLLATAVVILEDDYGNQYPARALLDSGSESNLLTERMSQRLKTTRERVEICVIGIGQAATKVKQRIHATVRSRVSEFSRAMSFLVLPKVTVNLPTTTVQTKGWRFPDGIQLADPSFSVSSEVDIVLGIESFFDFFHTGEKIDLGDQLPSLNHSVFGWVVCGGLPIPRQAIQVISNASITEDPLEAMMARFWSCEEVESTNILSPEEARCESLFSKTVKRESDGRYTVALPRNDSIIDRLGESQEIAMRRFLATERRLSRDENLRKQYEEFMEEYVHLGHMQKIVELKDESCQKLVIKRCFLPHHPVVKEASTTTKVRVVFDASCKTSSGVSLNDGLLNGPVIQDDLRSIILRCRTKQVMVVADIEKMFRQINIAEDDRPLQSILWRSSPKEEISIYELRTVTYGTKPAPFLATRTLQQLATDGKEVFPLAARAVLNDTYMDDVITGSDTVEEASELQVQLDALMSSGGFRLRKYASNSPDVLKNVSEDNLAIKCPEGINLDPDPSVKTLGLTWMPTSDVFSFQFSIPAIESIEPLTKRRILSVIAMLFDPLGLIGAVIATAKIFMQKIWMLRDAKDQRLGWDEPVPLMIDEAWRKYHQQLSSLNEIRINRCVIISNPVLLEIHCFSDASEKAYGACVYIRSQNSQGQRKATLLTSKSRVAPLKSQSIPRLELCGALLGAQLVVNVKKALKGEVSTFFWTDSTCVLRWLSSTPSTWTTFVANRVSKIQTMIEGCQWNHVAGKQNPADLISRGILPEEIVDNEFWWNGPQWLVESMESWPIASVSMLEEEGEDERRHKKVAATTSVSREFNNWFISHFSDYTKLIRSTAIWIRLIRVLRKSKEGPTSGFLKATELSEAEMVMVRLVQRECFQDELKSCSRGETVPRKSPLRWFNPFIQNGIIKVGGRLMHSQESEDFKHPMVLPANHNFTKLLFESYHKKLLRAGPQLTLCAVRQRFWPLGGRSVIRNVIHKCIKCFRVRPKPMEQFMGDLPAARVRESRPFTKTGVDYFGPVYLRHAPRKPSVKAYVAVFICFATKAVHLELVTDLTTDRFLQALRRFIGRWGKVSDIYSDNGTNFIGARNYLHDLMKLLRSKEHHELISKYCANDGIQWHLNPPRAPHFGGLWEAAVKSAKHHIIRVIGDHPLSFEDMQTLLVQVEACLNSRPITQQSDDPNDLEPLTPAHFWLGSSLQALPERDLSNIPVNRLDKTQLIQQKVQQIWNRWRKEYLSQLQARTKRWNKNVNIEIGRLVVICDDNVPPIHWKMGRISEVHPGQDGIVRVVTLKTSNGYKTRAVERICFLPIEPESDMKYDTVQA